MTIQGIKNQILAEKANQEALEGLNSSSNVAIYNIWAYVVATVVWTLYQFFKTYTAETDQKIREQKRYTLLWFREKALAFRYGQALQDNAEYSDDGLDAEQIAEMQIVARAAVIELELGKRKNLFIKVAKESNSDLAALTPEEITSLEQYFAIIKPAGTKIIVFSDAPDQLKLDIRFFYDPLVLDSNGARIDGSNNTPVQDVINNYLTVLKFNGEFSIAALIDLLQDVEGCADREVYIDNVEANYLQPAEWQNIESSYVANSGYMRIAEEDLNIEFIPKTVQL
ncbi:hypothetical protein [Psychroflexus sp. ALD_RP9]|uniref:hypothetical protein n=1 Tax=Psychroflexus sp. ALD_RP9 TaxID=2777186 RepID=UPI001A8F1557|nr:hypothetical protein [Psychroflexus sp. ALD_RP9]QSS96577.1 hypothetical protein IMZ30_09000 [Psychroflexus sp. ALD_RP9]